MEANGMKKFLPQRLGCASWHRANYIGTLLFKAQTS